MRSVNERIRSLMHTERMNASSFSRFIGMSSNATINKIIKDEDRKPSYQVIEAIVEAFPRLNTEWLIRGQGEMYSENSLSQPLTNENETSDVMPRILRQLEQHNDYMRQLCNQFVKI